MADSLYRKVVPAQIRTFVETLAGKKDPITEKDFTDKELEQMRAAVRYAQTKPSRTQAYNEGKKQYEYVQPRRDVVGYDDYGLGKSVARKDWNVLPEAAARNTLGQFRFQKTPDGRTVAIDKYDFEDDLVNKGERSSAEYAKMSTAEKLAALAKDTVTRPRGIGTLPSRVGSAFIGKEGRPVSIDLGEGLKKGGAVKSKASRGDGIAQRGKTKGRFV
jgi:hypothetical protein